MNYNFHRCAPGRFAGGCKNLLSIWLIGAIVVAFTPVTSYAAKYSKLKSQGFKSGSLSRNAAGQQGYIVSKGDERHFCKLRASSAILNSKTIIFLTSSGRQIKGDRKTYEKRAGPVEGRMPLWSKVKNGTLDSRHIGRCRKMR